MMTAGSRFIAAAVAALGVSVASAGFLAARRSYSQPQAESAGVSSLAPQQAASAEPAPAAVPSPVATPEVEPPDQAALAPAPETETVVRRAAAPKPRARVATKAPAPAPVQRVPANRPVRDVAPPPASEPVVEPRATAPPAPLPVPAAAPTSPRTVAVAPAPRPAATVETAPVEVPEPRFEEYTVKADSVLGIRLDQSVSSATARLEDRVTASVSRDVLVNGRTAVPAGARLEGNVTLVEPGSKFKGRARLGIRFHTLVMADGLRVPIQTETLFRDGDSATGSTAKKVGGGAAAGAILGAVLGGKKGAIIGAGVGAAGGTAAVVAGDNKDAVLESGTPLTMRLTSPVTVTIERD
jgi:outer membrane biosynthesis protein TonB